jgi:toxin ParE1/3/4
MPQAQRTPEAEADLINILVYVGRQSARPADRLAATIDQKCQMLAEFPDRGTSCEDLAPGLRYFPVGKYLIFYRLIPDGIEVIRVVHGARDLPSLFP